MRDGSKTLDPVIAARFCASADHLLERARNSAPSVREAILAAEPGPRSLMTGTQVEAAARALADFADLKAPHFVGHSDAVAQLAANAARTYGLPESDAIVIRRAGFIHEVGQVGVSSGIWCKPGMLTEAEWERVRLHPYYITRIFTQPQALIEHPTPFFQCSNRARPSSPCCCSCAAAAQG